MRELQELERENEELHLVINEMLWRVKDMEFRLSLIVNREQERRVREKVELARKAKEAESIANGIPISVLDLCIRTQNNLRCDSIYTIQELTKRSEKDLLKIPNIGRRAVNEIVAALVTHGLSLRGNE